MGSWWYGHLWWFYYFLHFDLSETIAFARYQPTTPALLVTSETFPLSLDYSNRPNAEEEKKIKIAPHLISSWMSILTAPRLTPRSRAVCASSSNNPILLSVEFIAILFRNFFSCWVKIYFSYMGECWPAVVTRSRGHHLDILDVTGSLKTKIQ